MEQEPNLRSIGQIRRQAEKTFGEKYASDADAFVDAYANGQYHEEEQAYVWRCIARKLSKREIADTVPSIIHPLIKGPGSKSEGPDLEAIMAFHEAMYEWDAGRLTDVNVLLDSMVNVRTIIAKRTREENYKLWLLETLRTMQLIHIAVMGHLGVRMDATQIEYDNLIEVIFKQAGIK